MTEHRNEKYNTFDAMLLAAPLSPLLSVLAGSLQGGILAGEKYVFGQLSDKMLSEVGVWSFVAMVILTQIMEGITLHKSGATHNLSALAIYAMNEKRAINAIAATMPVNVFTSLFTNPYSAVTLGRAFLQPDINVPRLVSENLAADAMASLIVSLIGCTLFASGAARPVARMVDKIRQPILQKMEPLSETLRYARMY